ncbi:hypothetical protein BWI97_20505 [Siphonobacter sp. BAB-5405]|uniref:hypothetical protein n=1 Tax=Siphonobacter sp. BAB-5405 TaxID=1864825 RepID=UPI000C80BC27|nr:hypothetical protein [Siphonobacter sp. BAB-5405]PMD92472.1 hypothetical protein BWI97_20505 [Siphonobacter sp. BAB-5405]
MKVTFFLLSFLSLVSPVFAQQLRTGSHDLRIQWIEFNNAKPGTVEVTSLGKGKYKIEGEQRDPHRNEYVTIKGTFEVAERKLLFDGKIVSRIEYINEGKPCERVGPQVFRATGTRRYWRLFEKLNCDGITTDYIDIFF